MTIHDTQSFRCFGKLMNHYLTLALQKAGVRVDGDVRAEINGMCDALGSAIEDVVTDVINHHQDNWHGGEE